MIGETFGNYRILAKRGEGGMGMFFKATDLQLDRIVGLKTLRPELLADAELRARLQTEARSLARLVHQNIANVLHYLVEGDHHFIVMEFVEGKDLADVVRSSGLLPLEQLGPIVSQICAAIAFAHSKGVIHRDLKPSNIMVTDDWTVKVTDFGIAKILGDKAQTRTGVAAGSLHYMAPEQIRATGVDARSDIYQMGAMLYELVGGHKPFVSDSEYELMTMQLQEMPPAPSSVSDRVPPLLDTVLLKALAKEPDQRYQTAIELDEDFQRALRGEQPLAATGAAEESPTTLAAPAIPEDREATRVVPTSQETPPAPRQKRVAEPPRRKREKPPAPPQERSKLPLFAGVGVSLIAVIAVILWVMKPWETTEQPIEIADVPACTLAVAATIPSEISDSDVARVVLRVDHPDSGTTSIDLYPTDGQLRHTLLVTPADALNLTISGYDAESNSAFEGSRTVSAIDGTSSDVSVSLKAAARHLEPNLVINVQPFNARDKIDRLWIDGREITGGELFSHNLTAGHHKIMIQTGDNRLTDTVMVYAGRVVEKSLFVGTQTGRMSVAAIFPGDFRSAAIWIDGKDTEQGTPKLIRDLLEGPHEVTVRAEGFASQESYKIVYVQPDRQMHVAFQMVER